MFTRVKNYFEGKTIVQLMGFWGILIVDMFSVMTFFRLQGDNWILVVIPLVFVCVKVWHWVQFFITPNRLKKALHLTAWFLLSAISVYSFITLGLSITEMKEKKTDTQIAVSSALDTATLTTITSLSSERVTLSENLTRASSRLQKVSVWGDESKIIRSQLKNEIDAANERIKEIDETLLSLSQSSKEDEKKEAEAKPWYYVEAIGSEALLSQVLPVEHVKLAVVILFLIVGLAMELTLDLTSLPKEVGIHRVKFSTPIDPDDKLSPEIREDGDGNVAQHMRDWVEAVQPTIEREDQHKEDAPQEKEPDSFTVAEENTEAFESYASRMSEPADPTPVEVEKTTDPALQLVVEEKPVSKPMVYLGKPNISRLLEFIDCAYVEDGKRLLSEELLLEKHNFPIEETRAYKKYLSALKFKGVPLLESARGGTFARVRKEILKRLITIFDTQESSNAVKSNS